MNEKTGQALGLFVLRVSVGLYMLLAGVGKVQAEIKDGLGTFANGPFSSLQPSWLPDGLGLPYGYVLPWLEVLIGLFLIVGFYTRLTALAGMGMLASFTIALIIAFDTISAVEPGDPYPFSPNYIQCAAYLLLALVGAGAWSIDALKGKRK